MHTADTESLKNTVGLNICDGYFDMNLLNGRSNNISLFHWGYFICDNKYLISNMLFLKIFLRSCQQILSFINAYLHSHMRFKLVRTGNIRKISILNNMASGATPRILCCAYNKTLYASCITSFTHIWEIPVLCYHGFRVTENG